ncbi:MAG TPA: class II glutamine amidotransferase [Solirubrobacterales bacterium]|nr:class II glutamine amidotransferase [Solirubrobacterales bacterium]
MCRLFALHAGDRDVAADFWLLNAPDSIARQSEINADGYGLAALTSKQGMLLMRSPVQAASNPAYNAVAERLVAAEMLVHLRYADTGKASLVNTHPFSQDGRIFAHNGVVGDLDQIEERLGSNRAMVMGQTDSERFFALITLAIRETGGDVRAGIKAAVSEVVDRYELYSLNFVLAEQGNIWGFRYPDKNPLHLFRRTSGDAGMHHSDEAGTLQLHLDEAGETPVVVISSEQISEEPGWEEIESGELIHIGPDLEVDRETIVDGPPRHPMVLKGRATVSQTAK